ncbi:MAG TPA: MmcQ/YjbR family DNA-binding protein [Myxococcota bacterium]|nr:MmcQ/YjbR family DNA-binding protein [Myxococcota bacterium]
MNARGVERALARLRKICLALPESSERLSHGEPTFFVGAKAGKGGKVFVMFANDHHGDDIVGFWCPAEPGAQATLIEADPVRFFRPPYVGPSGWIGVRLDRAVDWEEIAQIAADSWRLVAPKRIAAAFAAARC